VELARNAAADLRLLPWLSRALGTIRRDGPGFDPTPFLDLLARQDGDPAASRWQVQRTLPTYSDSVVVLVGPPGQGPDVIVKVAGGPHSNVALEDEKGALTALHADTRLERLHDLIPVVRGEGVLGGRQYLVETVVRGVAAESVLRAGARTGKTLAAAARTIAALHDATRSDPAPLDDWALERWVDEPVAVIDQVTAYRPHGSESSAALARVADLAHQAFIGKAVPRSWIHGDYVPANIFVTPDGGRVTGMVDWEFAVPDGLPHLDVLHLLLSTRVLVRRRELGQVVRELLTEPQLDDSERAALELAWQELPGEPLDLRSLILLCWLQIASATLLKSDRYRRSRLWVALNVESVLRAYAG
jgi:aminoglycoside phosphotransferase (APT) family kinase protein